MDDFEYFHPFPLWITLCGTSPHHFGVNGRRLHRGHVSPFSLPADEKCSEGLSVSPHPNLITIPIGRENSNMRAAAPPPTPTRTRPSRRWSSMRTTNRPLLGLLAFLASKKDIDPSSLVPRQRAQPPFLHGMKNYTPLVKLRSWCKAPVEEANKFVQSRPKKQLAAQLKKHPGHLAARTPRRGQPLSPLNESYEDKAGGRERDKY